MGMFDEVVCHYPLPHHQDATFQTKDLAAIVAGELCLGGLLDEYVITDDGRLRRHRHEREWTEDPTVVFGGYLKSIRDWWEDVPDVHGDIRIYATESADDRQTAETADGTAVVDTGDGTMARPAIRVIEFRIRFAHGRVQHVQDLRESPPPDVQADNAAPRAVGFGERISGAPPGSVEEQLLANTKASLASLQALLQRVDDHWGREDVVYRHYHHSFKVYWIQPLTIEIVTALQQLMPDRPLCELFTSVVAAGTEKTFVPEHNLRWADTTRPMLEAFFHAHYFLEMIVKYGRILDTPPRVLPSGWAAVLTLFGLR